MYNFSVSAMKAITDNKIVSIVDDEIDITDLFHDALYANIKGISVVSFNDPKVAFEHYMQNKGDYALIISDMRMPTMSGLELLKKIKEHNLNVRTILLSAFDMQDNPELANCLKNGIVDMYIEKPVTIQRLCQIVRDEVQAYQVVLNKHK